MISAGPIAFSANERARLPASSWRQLFSGPWRSCWRNPVASITIRSSPVSAANVAARSRLTSSCRSMGGDVFRLKPTTCRKLSVELSAATMALPIPPPEPKITAMPPFGNEPRSTVGVGPVDVRGASVTAPPSEAADVSVLPYHPDRQPLTDWRPWCFSRVRD